MSRRQQASRVPPGRRQQHVPPQEPESRQNEYFLPGEGISRAVIQADICRYLGNDALVRLGTYQGRDGYIIRAYRSLTTQMIAELKADSDRWETEVSRRAMHGRAPVVYEQSGIHDARQESGLSQTHSHYPGRTTDARDPGMTRRTEASLRQESAVGSVGSTYSDSGYQTGSAYSQSQHGSAYGLPGSLREELPPSSRYPDQGSYATSHTYSRAALRQPYSYQLLRGIGYQHSGSVSLPLYNSTTQPSTDDTAGVQWPTAGPPLQDQFPSDRSPDLE